MPTDIEAGFHVYYVKDNGLGIPEAYHHRVFTAFNRLHAEWHKGKASALPWCAAWWNGTAARSGWSRLPGSGTTFFVACRPAPCRVTASGAGGSHSRTRTHEGDNLMAAEPILIVLAEDDDGHASLVERNLKRAGVANGIQRLKDGQEAIDFFSGNGASSGQTTPQPMLLLLDIKMPRVDGIEVLRQLKSNPQTAVIPVIMLTTTDDPREIQRCYELGMQRLHHQAGRLPGVRRGHQSARLVSPGRAHPRLQPAASREG